MSDMRETLVKSLEREFGSYLDHPPHNPERFWGQAADAVLSALKASIEDLEGESYRSGHAEGYDDGYGSGYSEGYDVGLKDGGEQ